MYTTQQDATHKDYTFVCLVLFLQRLAIISLNSVNRLVFITESQSASREVGAEFLLNYLDEFHAGATGHLERSSLAFPSVFKQVLRWFPCFARSPHYLNSSELHPITLETPTLALQTMQISANHKIPMRFAKIELQIRP
jgi:hypothetical protein